MCLGINTGDTFALACCIGESGVTAQAKLTSSIYVELFRFFRMVHGWTVAVFAGDYAVKFFCSYLHDGAMARATVFMHSFAA